MSQLDPDVEIMLPVCGKPIPRSRLHVQLSTSHNRLKLPEGEEAIDAVWAERLSTNPKLWNGTKFRLASAIQMNESVTMDIGITSYKDFIGTNWSPRAAEYKQLGRELHKNSQVFLSDALGVGSLVETRDHKFILLKRSAHCGEATGLYDVPGGHPEPQEIVGTKDCSEIEIEKIPAEKVIDEIFNSTLREIVDEVNIPLNSLSDPGLIGIARNTTSSGRPSSEYHVRCSLTSEEIQDLYNEGCHLEAEESIGIIFIPMVEIPHIIHSKTWTDLAPSAKGCILLYNLLSHQNT